MEPERNGPDRELLPLMKYKWSNALTNRFRITDTIRPNDNSRPISVISMPII
jgi:hypothetical protein